MRVLRAVLDAFGVGPAMIVPWVRGVGMMLLFVLMTAQFFDCGFFTAGLKPCPFKEVALLRDGTPLLRSRLYGIGFVWS
jgi:hypothetical protein